MGNHRKDKPLTRITVSVDPDDYASMEQLARTLGLSTSWLIRQAMREFLGRHREAPAIHLSWGKQSVKEGS